MPLNSAQLAELVSRARHKTPPAVSPPPAPVAHRSVGARQATPAPQTPSTAQPPSGRGRLRAKQPIVTATASADQAAPPAPVSVPPPEHVAEVDDFPTGWELRKESWHFHRRFHVIFRRAMRHGEYSQLLGQIRRRSAKHLWEDCWRVTLPGSSRTLPVRATRWRLITILPKDWQPPASSSRQEVEP